MNFFSPTKRNHKGQRRLSCLFIVPALVVNGLLFYGLSWVNHLPRQYPAVPRYTTIEMWTPPTETPAQPIVPEPIRHVKAVRLEQPPVMPRQEAPLPTAALEPRLSSWGPTCLSRVPDIAAAAVTVAATRADTQPASLSAEPTYQIAQVDQPPAVIKAAAPAYPYQAQQRNVEGFVDLRFVVKRDGTVSQIATVHCEGSRRFIQAATDAVKKWIFQPATLDGRNVDVWCTQRIQFRMDN